MSHIINYIFILYILLSTYAKKITTEYNFGEYQDPDIDKSYSHLLGRNIYFVTEVPEKSFYITVDSYYLIAILRWMRFPSAVRPSSR